MDIKDAPKGAVLGQSEDPFEAAATMFGLYSIQLEQRVKLLDTEQLRTLAIALMFQPVAENDISYDQTVLEVYKEAKALLANRDNTKESLENKVKQLSTGELRRLVNAVIQYPLSDKYFIDSNSGQNLRDAFSIGQRLNEAKSLMFLKQISDYETSQMEKNTPQEG
jgi:translation initiation factor RLI1